jgi:hypothetical protein
MIKSRLDVGIIALLLLYVPAAAQPSENQAQVGADLSFYSKYIWRGMVWDEEPVLQPDLWMTVGRLTMTFWGSMDLTDSGGDFEGQFNEWDGYIDVDLGALGPLTFGSGLSYLNFFAPSGVGSSTTEISASAIVNIIGNPTLTAYWDIWQYHGVYANMSLSHDIAVGPSALSLSLSAGWGDHRHNGISGAIADGGLLDFQAGAAYPISLGAFLTLTPSIQYSALLQDDVRRYYDDSGISPDNWFFALNAAMWVGR